MDWKNHLEKNPIKKRQNSKNQSQIAACEQKTTSEKANFCSNTVFSLYFKIGVKKFHATKPLAFSLQARYTRLVILGSLYSSVLLLKGLFNSNCVVNHFKSRHSRQIAGKKPPLPRMMHIGVETDEEKKRDKLTEFLSGSVSKSVLIGRSVSN